MKREYPDILTIEQCAEILQVDQDSIVVMVFGGEIPAFRVGEDYRIRKSDLKDFIQNQIESFRNEVISFGFDEPQALSPIYEIYEMLTS